MKSNKEIMKELQTRGRFKTPEEVDKYFLKVLEEKDKEKLEIIESVPQQVSMAFSVVMWKERQINKLK